MVVAAPRLRAPPGIRTVPNHPTNRVVPAGHSAAPAHRHGAACRHTRAVSNPLMVGCQPGVRTCRRPTVHAHARATRQRGQQYRHGPCARPRPRRPARTRSRPGHTAWCVHGAPCGAAGFRVHRQGAALRPARQPVGRAGRAPAGPGAATRRPRGRAVAQPAAAAGGGGRRAARRPGAGQRAAGAGAGRAAAPAQGQRRPRAGGR